MNAQGKGGARREKVKVSVCIKLSPCKEVCYANCGFAICMRRLESRKWITDEECFSERENVVDGKEREAVLVCKSTSGVPGRQ